MGMNSAILAHHNNEAHPAVQMNRNYYDRISLSIEIGYRAYKSEKNEIRKDRPIFCLTPSDDPY